MRNNYLMPIKWNQFTIDALVPLLNDCQRYCSYVRNAMCSSHGEGSYRSDALAQLAQKVLPQSCHTTFSPAVAAAFSQYLSKKAELIQALAISEDIRVDAYQPLSLLLVNWQGSLFDGACTPETYGYLDTDCIPGWDTWLAIVSVEEPNEYALLCWVPPELCRDVDSAIAVDAAACLSWVAFDRRSSKPFIVGWGRQWEAPRVPESPK